MGEENRRTFVKKIGAASALAAGGFLNWNPRAIGANEKVVLGLIGGRNQGRGARREDARHRFGGTGRKTNEGASTGNQAARRASRRSGSLI